MLIKVIGYYYAHEELGITIEAQDNESVYLKDVFTDVETESITLKFKGTIDLLAFDDRRIEIADVMPMNISNPEVLVGKTFKRTFKAERNIMGGTVLIPERT